MGYYIDLNGISIDQYQEILRAADLLPSRMILKENIDEIFGLITEQGIATVADLQQALKNKNRLQCFSQQSGIPEDYLKILIREVNSYQPRPNKLSDFPGVAADVVHKLERAGIKNTMQLFDRVLTGLSKRE
jgi:hypothetical protein